MEDIVLWSRAQFALTAIYHWLFVPLTLGLGVIIGVMETIYYRTKNEEWKTITKFWMRLFGVNFAIGVATGLILEFQFGTNWSNYSWFVGDIFGAPLAIEGILAFFLEATFIAVMFFGWNKVSKGFHLASTWLTVFGASISALWILIANAWMQFPTGMTFNPDTVRNEMTDFWAVALSPIAINKFFHTVTSCWVVGSAACIGVSAWFLLKKRHIDFAKKSIQIGAIVGLVGILLTIYTGDGSAYQVAQKQPMKLAAMEGLYKGQTQAPLVAVGILKPHEKAMQDIENPSYFNIGIPYALSFLSYRDANAFVPGITDLLNGGYPTQDGSKELSAKEKMESGKKAVMALADYKKAKKAGNDYESKKQLEILNANYANFGYGFIKDESELIPNVAITFYAFRFMVIFGSFFIIMFLAVTYFIGKKKPFENYTWFLWLCILCIPLAYMVSQSGWLVAEMGRQPWVIQDLMPTSAAISAISSSSVATTFIIFCVLFSVLLIAELSIMFKQIKKGF
ncbi:MAG: cytochrome ubiquinol oxidase subunit I [Bacteroidales bacterium]|jgi:cytochrome d ubiquinol oxidase subunit I|nr:cytochrome ubiquinol oxidase subunit I [Bacteroidales bacterium]MDD4738928.1 cytochrome ubiquinol oxidase subunit I [Bacteroidales bacterium]